MSIATKCVCGRSISGICLGSIKGCSLIVRDLNNLFTVNDCTEEEKIKLKAFLFAIRHKDIDLVVLERIIKKYSHIL
jgi:hypothetical protein